MPTALVIRCKLRISQPNAWQHQDVSVMVHHKPNILHLHEITVKERGRILLHTCCILLQYPTFYYFTSSSSITLKWVSGKGPGLLSLTPCLLKNSVVLQHSLTGTSESQCRVKAENQLGVGAGSPKQAYPCLPLNFLLLPFSGFCSLSFFKSMLGFCCCINIPDF